MKLSEQADWLAIVSHFFVGALVGGASAVLGVIKFGFIYKETGEILLGTVLCVSVVCGASYAIMQNLTWVGYNYRVIPPIPPTHSSNSLAFLISLIILSISGLIFMVLWLIEIS